MIIEAPDLVVGSPEWYAEQFARVERVHTELDWAHVAAVSLPWPGLVGRAFYLVSVRELSTITKKRGISNRPPALFRGELRLRRSDAGGVHGLEHDHLCFELHGDDETYHTACSVVPHAHAALVFPAVFRHLHRRLAGDVLAHERDVASRVSPVLSG